MQAVPITTNVVSSNSVHGEVYTIQQYVMKFVSDLRQVGGFLRVLRFPQQKKIDRHEIAEILLKVTLNTIILTLTLNLRKYDWCLKVVIIACNKIIYQWNTGTHVISDQHWKSMTNVTSNNRCIRQWNDDRTRTRLNHLPTLNFWRKK